MHPTLQAFINLQEVDRKIFKVESEMERLPKERAQREEALGAQAGAVEDKQAEALALRTQAKEIEHHTTTLRQRQRKLEHSSSSGKVDAAMLASYDHEIRNLKRTISDAEGDALRQLEQAETIEKEIIEMTANLEQERGYFTEFSANVDKELAEATIKRDGLLAKRSEVSAEDIPAAQLETYKGLLKTREGEALAELSSGICQGCFVNIPRNKVVLLARGTDLVHCPSCARILFAYS